MQVRIFSTEISWLLGTDHGKEFIEELVSNPECLSILQLESSKEIFNYIWYECVNHIIWVTFLPFCILTLLPLTMLAVLIQKVEQGSSTALEYFLYYLSTFVYAIGVVLMAYQETKAIRANGLVDYVTSSSNWFGVTFMICSLLLLFQIVIASGVLVSASAESLEGIANQ